MLKDFDAEFAKGDGKRGRVTTFVSAGVQNAGSRPGDDIDDARRGSTYALGAFEPEVATASAERAERSPGTSEAAPGTSKSGGKPRAIDALMGEMKAKQEERERVARDATSTRACPTGIVVGRGRAPESTTRTPRIYSSAIFLSTRTRTR